MEATSTSNGGGGGYGGGGAASADVSSDLQLLEDIPEVDRMFLDLITEDFKAMIAR